MDLTSRALSHILGFIPGHLRSDTPLQDIGADSVAVIVFGDVVEAFAATAGLDTFRVDNERLRVAKTVGELSSSISWEAV